MKLLLDSADVVDLKSFHFVKKNRLTQFSQTLLLAVLIQPNSKETAGFRKFLEKTLSQSSSIKSLSMLLLGTDEVLANIVEHELQDSPRQNIEIRLY